MDTIEVYDFTFPHTLVKFEVGEAVMGELSLWRRGDMFREHIVRVHIPHI
jgi:hypothetical protein